MMRVTRRIAFLAMALALTGLGSPSSAAPVNLRAASFVPDRVVHVREVLVPWIGRLNRELAGEAEITLFSGGALGRDGAMQWRLVTKGVADIAWFPLSYEAGRFPAAEMFDFPLLADDAMELTRAFWRLHERGLLGGFEEVVVLMTSVSPPYAFHLGFPIAAMDDLAGRKIRVLNGAQAAVVEALGATAISGMSAMQIAESMSRNLVDGALFNWHSLRSVGIERVARTHIMQPAAFSPSVLVMNRRRYESLSPRARRAIDAASGEALSVAFTRSLIKEAAASIARVGAAGHQLYEPSDEEGEVFREVFDRLREDWGATGPDRRRLLDALAQTLAGLREANERNGRGSGSR